MSGFKSAVAALSVVTMIGSSAFAGELAPLTPGKPAGVHEADLGLNRGTVVIGLGVVAIITAIAITVGSQKGGNPGTLAIPSGTNG